MRYHTKENGIVIEGKEQFDPKHILECGQVFSYLKDSQGNYTVYSADQSATILPTNDGYFIQTSAPHYFENYFDLATDYSQIGKELSAFPIMQRPIKFGQGIRILKQDLWETLLSFIISANNNIKRIQSILWRLRNSYGTQKEDFNCFPTSRQLLAADIDDFKNLGLGYRARYLFEVLRQIDEQGLKELSSLPTEQLKGELLKLSGVGPKVADCILLFGYGKTDVFPVDTWIAAMYNHYFSPTQNRQLIRENLVKEFGSLSGYAQQYLFYSMRETKE
jgi:N-glycosylase/DNA lyase